MRNQHQSEVTLYIVDDDLPTRESMVDRFGAGCGFRVQSFASGEEFLARVDLGRADCLLLDLRMGEGMTGLQVHDALRAKSSPMLVLFLSGHGTIPTALEAQAKGAEDWLEKGMDTDQLQAKVVDTMQKARARAAVWARWNTLSPRKKEAARHIRKGWASKLVADEMGVGERVIFGYRGDVFETMWVNNPTELDRLMRDNAIE